MPGTSLNAPTAKSTVTSVSVVDSAVISVTSTFVLSVESIAAPVVVWAVPPFFTVILVLSTVPMASLKVRTTFKRSLEAIAVDMVGRMPSTLWLESAASAEWLRFAFRPSGPMMVLPPVATSRLFSLTLHPSLSSMPEMTVLGHSSVFVSVPTSQLKKRNLMYGLYPLPLSVMFLSNVNVTTMTSPMM